MDQDDLEAQVRAVVQAPRETRQFEFKAARTQYSFDRAAEYCAALANEGGGMLVLGVTNKAPRRFEGTDAFGNPQDTEKKLHDVLRQRVEVHELSIDGARIVVIKVGARPPGQAVPINGRYLMRQGESLVNMTNDHLRQILTGMALAIAGLPW